VVKRLLLALTAVLLIGWFSSPISDSDFWWHLKTGQYIAETHRLPVPDPFAWTTAAAPAAYPGEPSVRQFNLTHEWLAQVLYYLIWRAAGFPGIVLFRALLLATLCGLIGWIVWRRTGHYYRSLLAALCCASEAFLFANDRPYLISYVLLALTLCVLESRRRLWLLPVILLAWANLHGGYFLGWCVCGAYCAAALLARRRDWPLWTASAAAVLASGLNPNGFHVLGTLGAYRSSYMTSRLNEWARPQLWPPQWWTVLLAAAAAVLLWQARRVRLSDWLLFAGLSAVALTAVRNLVLVAIVAPLILGTYIPFWKRGVARVTQVAAAAALAAGIACGAVWGGFFRFGAAEWKFPSGAADFLLAHGGGGRLFNTYEHGGYLIWRLWPQQRVFIDGRALSESLFLDYARILYNHDASGGPSGEQLLDRYGIDTIAMNTFEAASGAVYVLAPALADPSQQTWKLVYSDDAAVVFMRHPPPGVTPLPSLQVFDHMEAECAARLRNQPEFPRCARSLGQTFARIGDFRRARYWLRAWLDQSHPTDPEAEDAYRRYVQSGY
jgi:hypothetical protein